MKFLRDNAAEFDSRFAEIQQCFHPNAYTASRICRIFEICQDLTVDEWARLAQEVIDCAKTPVMPEEFKTKVSSIKRSRNWYQQMPEVPSMDCYHCLDTGFVLSTENGVEGSWWMFCHCFRGRDNQASGRHKLPQWRVDDAKFLARFKMRGFPAVWFKVQPGDDVFKKAANWNGHIAKSVEYWHSRQPWDF